MAGHVTESAGAEIPPAAPVVRMIDRVIRPLGADPRNRSQWTCDGIGTDSVERATISGACFQ